MQKILTRAIQLNFSKKIILKTLLPENFKKHFSNMWMKSIPSICSTTVEARLTNNSPNPVGRITLLK